MATESDNVNSGALGTLVAVGTIAFFGIALVVTALVRAEMQEELEKKEISADRPYRDLVADQTAKLAAPAAFIDRNTGKVSLPIDRAMELTVEGLKKDPNSATPPAPAGGSSGVGGAEAAAAGGGAGGTGGAGGAGGSDAKPVDEAVNAEPVPSQEGQPAEEKKDEKKDAKEKKKAPAPKPAPVPAAPAPAAPNGQ